MTARVGLDDLDPTEAELFAGDVDRRGGSAVDGLRPAVLVRGLAALAAVSVGMCTLAIAALHVLPAGRRLDPVAAPISNYAQTRAGWLFDSAVIVLALGLAALVCALVVGGWVATRSPVFAVLTVCFLGVVAVVIFPDTTADGALTAAGQMHWSAAMATFAGIPLAPSLLGHGREFSPGSLRLRRRLTRWLSLAAGLWFAVLFLGSLLQFSTTIHLWHVGGAVERALALTDMLIAVLLATWIWRRRPPD